MNELNIVLVTLEKRLSAYRDVKQKRYDQSKESMNRTEFSPSYMKSQWQDQLQDELVDLQHFNAIIESIETLIKYLESKS